MKRIVRNFFHLGPSVGKSFFGFEIVRVLDAIRITQLAQDMVFYQWTNVEWHTVAFHRTPSYARAQHSHA